jgi:hypothetical protein
MAALWTSMETWLKTSVIAMAAMRLLQVLAEGRLIFLPVLKSVWTTLWKEGAGKELALIAR